MNPRILICRSNSIAPDPRVEKIGRALNRAGYAVQVLGWDRTAVLPRQEQANDFQIERLPIRAAYGSGLMNLPQLLRWQLGLLIWLIRRRKEYDLIHACDFDTILPALICKFFLGKQVVYDIFDFYADHLRRTPELLKKMIRGIDLWAIDQADALILVDDARREQVAGSSARHTVIIYNSPEDCADLLSPTVGGTRVGGDKIQPLEVEGVVTGQEATRADPAGLRLAYIGLLQVERGLFELLAVLNCHPEWKLDLAGFGGDEKQIAELAGLMPNVAWHGRVPYLKALELSAAADALLATYDPRIPNHRYSSPNKIFEAMMLGKPVIVARDTHMDQIVEATGCGLVVTYGKPEELEEALEKLAGSPALRRELGEKARQAYEDQFSWAIMASRLEALYRGLVDQRGTGSPATGR